MPEYRRPFAPGSSWFFTLVTEYRQQLLTSEVSRSVLRSAMAEVRQTMPFCIDAMVLLPDHVHCIWTLPEGDSDCSKRWGRIKALYSRQMKNHITQVPLSESRLKRHEAGFWQRRFWEHCIRDEDDFRRHLDYIHLNPVKHKLVDDVKDWPYSSFHRYVRQGMYPENWLDGSVLDEDINDI
ncbi:MAG: transposase [Oleibacter sp.]|nr:transposase [Thalassolituus sp.]|tara:strand:- start:178 stop:720 length:543 start_codon:yes stop_codon:yes gene_type:complete